MTRLLQFFTLVIITLSSCSKKDVKIEEESLNYTVESRALSDFSPPHQWYPIIQDFNRQDALFMPASFCATLLVGSSSIYMWEDSLIRAAFNPSIIIKRGLPGATARDAYYSSEDLVDKYKPKTVLLYFGDNDISLGMSTVEIMMWYTKLYDKIRRNNPNSLVIIMSCKPSVNLWSRYESNIRDLNEQLRLFAASKSNTIYIDVFTPMLLNEVPNPSLYKDGLHLTSLGYSIWANLLRPYISPVVNIPPPVDTVSQTPINAPIANAGVDQVLYASTRYCRINATKSSAYDPTKGWLTSVTWTQIAGATQFTFIDDAGNPANKANVKLYNAGIWQKGEYIFRCKVVDNKGNVSYDEVTIKFN